MRLTMSTTLSAKVLCNSVSLSELPVGKEVYGLHYMYVNTHRNTMVNVRSVLVRPCKGPLTWQRVSYVGLPVEKWSVRNTQEAEPIPTSGLGQGYIETWLVD